MVVQFLDRNFSYKKVNIGSISNSIQCFEAERRIYASENYNIIGSDNAL